MNTCEVLDTTPLKSAVFRVINRRSRRPPCCCCSTHRSFSPLHGRKYGLMDPLARRQFQRLLTAPCVRRHTSTARSCSLATAPFHRFIMRSISTRRTARCLSRPTQSMPLVRQRRRCQSMPSLSLQRKSRRTLRRPTARSPRPSAASRRRPTLRRHVAYRLSCCVAGRTTFRSRSS